jgi:hypothetical protein
MGRRWARRSPVDDDPGGGQRRGLRGDGGRGTNDGWGRRRSHRSFSAVRGVPAVVALPLVVNGRVSAVDGPDPGLGRRRTAAAAARGPLRSRPPCGVAAMGRTPSSLPRRPVLGRRNGTCQSMPVVENRESPRGFSNRCRLDAQFAENDSAAGRFSTQCMLLAAAAYGVPRPTVCRGLRCAAVCGTRDMHSVPNRRGARSFVAFRGSGVHLVTNRSDRSRCVTLCMLLGHFADHAGGVRGGGRRRLGRSAPPTTTDGRPRPAGGTAVAVRRRGT